VLQEEAETYHLSVSYGTSISLYGGEHHAQPILTEGEAAIAG